VHQGRPETLWAGGSASFDCSAWVVFGEVTQLAKPAKFTELPMPWLVREVAVVAPMLDSASAIQ
jgi:hypothetical protein